MTIQSALTAEETARLAHIGYAPDTDRAGTCILVDQSVRHISVHDNQVEILPLAEALKRYDWVQDLMFSLIAPDHDEHVRQASESTDPPLGHFVRVMEGAKLRLPVQLFDMIETPQQRQFFHNITVVEKGAEVEFVTGSSVGANVRAGHHVSISESFLREGATCRSVSVEQWGPEMQVHSYARSRIAKGAHSVATSIMMSPLRHHYSHSLTEIAEDGSSSDQAIVFAPEAPDDGVRGEPMPSDTILGTRPTPEGPVIETEPLPAERHVFGAVEIVLRKDAGRVMLSLRHDGRELPFDSRSLDPGLELILLDAFVLPRAGGDLLLLRSRIGSAVNWDAFVMAKDAITLSPDLSLRIHDAPDRATVTQHLSAE